MYSRPVRRHDTANDMSESRVVTPSSPNSRTRFGSVRSLCTRKPVSSGTLLYAVGIRTVLAQTRLLFEGLYPVSRAQEIGSGKARDAGADDRDVPQAPQEVAVRLVRCQAFVHDRLLTPEHRCDTLAS